jgi:hypothetical protein
MEQYLSNSLTKVFEPAMGQRVKYTANTGKALISVANANLDGTGTLVSVITGASNGTYVETITVTAIGNVTRGMVRLFLTDNELFTKLIAEIDIPEDTVSGIDEAFSTTLKVDFYLKTGYSIEASTQNAESFQVFAEGLDMVFP